MLHNGINSGQLRKKETLLTTYILLIVFLSNVNLTTLIKKRHILLRTAVLYMDI